MSNPYFQFSPVGLIRSPFKEKFGIPRQSGLVPAAEAFLELLPPFDTEQALREIEGFSHLWLIFVFHALSPTPWSPLVRPPRLGGNRRVGVFASRATHRPNPIGLSAVELVAVGEEAGRLGLHLRGADLLDGTPILDIKPYLPYADSLPQARAGFAPAPPSAQLSVTFTPEAAAACAARDDLPQLRTLIEQAVALDPRPAYQALDPTRIYGMRLFDLDVHWRVAPEGALVVALTRHP